MDPCQRESLSHLDDAPGMGKTGTHLDEVLEVGGAAVLVTMLVHQALEHPRLSLQVAQCRPQPVLLVSRLRTLRHGRWCLAAWESVAAAARLLTGASCGCLHLTGPVRDGNWKDDSKWADIITGPGAGIYPYLKVFTADIRGMD
jgi:hypothetical protein